MKNKICVYTCITGDYDELKDIKYVDKDYDYICFTNNKKIKSNFWKIIYIENDGFDNLTLARKTKIIGNEYLKKYDLTIWLDGAIEVLKPISKFLSDCCDLEKYDMIGFKHQERDCIYDEMNACIILGKETVKNVTKLEKFLLKEKYPKHNGLIESTILVRKNNREVNKLMNKWFEMVLNYSRRDQLSFNYCLYKNKIKINFLDMFVFDNKYFKHDYHKTSKKFKLYFGDPTYFDFHACVDGTYEIKNNKILLKNRILKNINRLELYIDENGNCIKDVKINKNAIINYNNICELDGDKYFNNNSSIIIEGEFNKEEKIEIEIEVLELINGENISLVKSKLQEKINELNIELHNKNNENDKLITEIDILNNKVLKLENINLENEKLQLEIKKILNSKGWKILEKLRKIKRKCRKNI